MSIYPMRSIRMKKLVLEWAEAHGSVRWKNSLRSIEKYTIIIMKTVSRGTLYHK